MKRSLNTARMNVRVGIMSVIAFAILVWVLFFPVRGVSPFARKITVTGYYERINGLRRNAPVYYRGIEVGNVVSVEVVADHVPDPLQVVVAVEKKIVPLLPKKTTMEIVAQGLLGDVFIDMVPGEPGGTIQEGDVLATKPYSSAMDGMTGLMDEIKTLFKRANSGEGTFGRLLRDDELYSELVRTVKSIGKISDRLAEIEKTINEKLLDPKAKQGVDSAIATAGRVLDNADKLTKKANDLKWYLGVGLNKYESTLSSSFAEITIVPNHDKFYRGGVEFFKEKTVIGPADYSSSLGGYLGYQGYLGLRVLDSPVFFRGGMKRTSVAAGLDFRLSDLVKALPVEVNADLYKYSQPTAQLDLGGSITFLKAFRLTGGADDVLNTPFWRGGISLIYDDEDLTSILIKSKM
jgi:hypothetical protein